MVLNVTDTAGGAKHHLVLVTTGPSPLHKGLVGATGAALVVRAANPLLPPPSVKPPTLCRPVPSTRPPPPSLLPNTVLFRSFSASPLPPWPALVCPALTMLILICTLVTFQPIGPGLVSGDERRDR